MSPSAMLATQSEGRCRQAPATQTAAASTASTGTQARRQSQPSAISATPATQNEGGCDQMPRLPRETKADVPNATPATQSAAASPATNPVQARHQSQPSALSAAAPATQNEGGCRQVPPLPRETRAEVAKRHACHVKRRWMSPSATPATQSAAVSPATSPSAAQCPKCRACHAKRRCR